MRRGASWDPAGSEQLLKVGGRIGQRGGIGARAPGDHHLGETDVFRNGVADADPCRREEPPVDSQVKEDEGAFREIATDVGDGAVGEAGDLEGQVVLVGKRPVSSGL